MRRTVKQKLLDEFAVRAGPVPKWFEPKMEGCPERTKYYEEMPFEMHMLLGKYAKYQYYGLECSKYIDIGKYRVSRYLDGLPDEIKEDCYFHLGVYADWAEAEKKWREERKKQKLLQWPYAYARMAYEQRDL